MDIESMLTLLEAIEAGSFQRAKPSTHMEIETLARDTTAFVGPSRPLAEIQAKIEEVDEQMTAIVQIPKQLRPPGSS